ncbi:MAG: DUF3592 domain-containing protein [Gammaproteobacteria bacterium]|nr:DUF3592 domain-containing protein [Gammaproteobacteria bacterium]
MTSSKSDHKKGLGCLTLFGGAFLLAGLGAFAMTFWPVIKSWQASDWQPVNAQVLDVEQTESRSDDGGTTYGVRGSFRYSFKQTDYQSSQLNFHTGSDNIGDYQKDFYRRLNYAKRNNRFITAYVNPNDPNQAVIDREIRWGMLGFGSIFLLVFGGVGGGIIFAGFWGSRKIKQENAYKQQFYDEPWKWKKEWQGDYFTADTKVGFIGTLIFAILWNAISLPATILGVPKMIEEGEYAFLFILLFPIIGLGMLTWAIVLYLRHRKYGSTRLYLNDGRIKIGAVNAGRFEFVQHRFENPDAIVKAALIHSYESSSGSKKTTRETVAWEDTYRVDLFSQPLEFQFKIPKGLQQTDESNSRSQYKWKISIESKQPGPDLTIDFEVPAFAISEAQSLAQEDLETDLFSDATSASTINAQSKGDWSKLGLIESHTNRGQEFYFPRQNKLNWSLMGLFGLVFVAIGIGVYLGGAPVLFPIVFGLMGGLIAIIGVRAALYKSRVFVESNSLHYQSGHFSFGKTISIPRDSIKNIQAISRASSGNTKFYNIIVTSNDGKQNTIAKHLKVKGDIDAFIDKLKRDLRLNEGL